MIYAISANIFWHLLFSNDGSGSTRDRGTWKLWSNRSQPSQPAVCIVFCEIWRFSWQQFATQVLVVTSKKHRSIRKNWTFKQFGDENIFLIAISIFTFWWISSCFILWLYIYIIYIFCWSRGPIIVVWLTVLLDFLCFPPRPDVCLAVPACWSSVDINFLRRFSPGWLTGWICGRFPGNLVEISETLQGNRYLVRKMFCYMYDILVMSRPKMGPLRLVYKGFFDSLYVCIYIYIYVLCIFSVHVVFICFIVYAYFCIVNWLIPS